MMTRPYSMDLRERVVAAVDGGQSRRSVARLFRLGEATVIRWAKRHITTGSVAAKPMGGIRRDVLGVERVWLRERMTAVPDLTVRALRAELLAERGLRVSYDAVWRFLRAERLTFKKKPAGRRAGSAGRGAQARTLETPSGADRSVPSGLCR